MHAWLCLMGADIYTDYHDASVPEEYRKTVWT